MQPPSALVSTYQQYKLDTNAVAGWLASTARSLGYPAHLLRSPTDNKSASSSDPSSAAAADDPPSDNKRLKGKQRVKAKKAAAAAAAAAKEAGASSAGATKGPKYIIRISSFVALAEFIAGKSAPVPASFGAVIDRVISTRSKYGDKLSKHGIETDQQTENTHEHFVRVLKQVRDVLRPFTLAPQNGDGNGRDAGDDGGLSNRFDGLHVDEPSQAFLDLPDVERPAPAAVGNETYEVQAEPSLQHAKFVFTAMLADTTRIRIHVWSIWSKIKEALNEPDADVDLPAAAIATDTAVGLARGIIEEATPEIEAFGNIKGMLRDAWSLILWQTFGTVGEHPKQVPVERAVDLIERMGYDRVAGTYMLPYAMLGKHLSHIMGDDCEPPLPRVPMEAWDPSRKRSLLSGAEKHDADESLLFYQVLEMAHTCRYTDWPVVDEVCAAICDIQETGEIPFGAAFACQTFLDVIHALGENVDKCHDRYNSSMAAIRREADAHLALAEEYGRAGVGGNEAAAELLSLQEDMDYITQDPLYHVAMSRVSKTGREDLAAEVALYRSSRKLVRTSPVISGLLTHHFRGRLRDATLEAANDNGSLLCGAHLYNLLLQQGLLGPTRRWVDMEKAIDLLGEGVLFVGKRPTGDRFEAYSNNFCLHWGAPLSVLKGLERGSVRSRVRYKGMRAPRLLTAQPHVLSVFDERYLSGDRVPGEFTAEYVENVIETSRLGYGDGTPLLRAAFTGSSSSNNNNNKNGDDSAGQGRGQGRQRGGRNNKKGRNRRSLRPDELVEPLYLALQLENHHAVFSYMTLHCAASRLLMAVVEACEARLAALGMNKGRLMTKKGGCVFPTTVVSLFGSGDLPALMIAAGVFNDAIDRGFGNAALKKLKESAIKKVLIPRKGYQAGMPLVWWNKTVPEEGAVDWVPKF